MNGHIVWMASYPKSGNTWFRAVYAAWRSGGPVDLNRLHAEGTGSIASSRIRIEAMLGIPSSLLTDDEVDLLRPRVDEASGGRLPDDVDDDSDDREEARASNTVLNKIHDALFVGPAGEHVVSAAATKGAIYLVRDPRDVAISFAHHNKTSHERTVAAMANPSGAMRPNPHRIGGQVRQRLGTWSAHVESWLDDAPFPVHVVRYEDCMNDPVPTFTDALRFAGFGADHDDVADAIELAHFDRLQEQEQESGFRERPPGVGSFFRSGRSGGWRDELAPALARRIERDHRTVMERLGYTIDELDDDDLVDKGDQVDDDLVGDGD